MLQCTEYAAAVLNEVRHRHGLPSSYGLRLRPSALPGGETSIELRFVASPSPGDEVAISRGTKLYIARDLAPKMNTLTLDMSPDPDAPGFVLRPPASN